VREEDEMNPLEKGSKRFGELIQALRQEKGWTVKEFIGKLKSRWDIKISPAYITRVEQYGEIPSPEFICAIADIFGYDLNKLLSCARQEKLVKFNKTLEEKYQKAAGLFRQGKVEKK